MKNQKQPHSQTIWSRSLAIFLLAPFLLFSLGATAKRSMPAKRFTAQKAKPKLKLVPWIGGGGTCKGYMSALSDQVDELQSTERTLQARIRLNNTQITEGAPSSTTDEIFRAQSAGGKTAAKVQGDQRLQSPSATMNSGQTTTTGGSGGQAGGQTPAALAKQQAALQETQSFISQYAEAKAQMQAATLGSEANYKALLEGRLKDSGGFYAQRAILDASGEAQIVPSGPCGDYPKNWCSAPPNARIFFGGSGFLNRQCVAYAAWKRWKNGQKFATGNAGNWPGNSARATVGSVAIWNISKSSPFGHVAYVTAVSRDSITISEFNWHPFLHSNRVIKPGGGGWPSRFWN